MSILKGKLEFVRFWKLQSWQSQDNWLGGLEGEESWADSDVTEASPSAFLGGLKTWRALVPQKTLSLNLVLTMAWDPISTLSDWTPVCFPHHFVGLNLKRVQLPWPSLTLAASDGAAETGDPFPRWLCHSYSGTSETADICFPGILGARCQFDETEESFENE